MILFNYLIYNKYKENNKVLEIKDVYLKKDSFI